MMALTGINDTCDAARNVRRLERDLLKISNSAQVLHEGKDKIATAELALLTAQSQLRVLARRARQASESAAFLDTRACITATGRPIPSDSDGCVDSERGVHLEAVWEGIAESDEREDLPHANMRTKTGLTLLQV